MRKPPPGYNGDSTPRNKEQSTGLSNAFPTFTDGMNSGLSSGFGAGGLSGGIGSYQRRPSMNMPP